MYLVDGMKNAIDESSIEKERDINESKTLFTLELKSRTGTDSS